LVCSWLIAVAAMGQCRWEPANASATFSTAVWTGSRFVGLGWDTDGYFVAVSPTGIDWTVTTRYTGGGLLAWNGHELMGIIAPNLWTSPDAVTWTEVTTDWDYLQPVFLTWAGERFFAFVPPLWWGGGALMSSADGADWSQVTAPVELAEVGGVVFTGSQYVAVGGEGPWVYTSPDAISWTSQPLPAAVGDTPYLRAVTWNGRLLVAVGDNGLIVTSPDGTTWTLQESGVSVGLDSVAVTSDGFVCSGDNGTLLMSHDGVTWQPEAAPTQNVIFQLIAAGSNTLAIDDTNHVFVRSCEERTTIRRHLSRPPE